MPEQDDKCNSIEISEKVRYASLLEEALVSEGTLTERLLRACVVHCFQKKQSLDKTFPGTGAYQAAQGFRTRTLTPLALSR